MEGDEVCLVCGGPPRAPTLESVLDGFESESEAQQLQGLSFQGLEWLKDNVGITEKEEVTALGAYNNYSGFYLGEKSSGFGCATHFRGEEPSWDAEDGPYGLTCHEKCFKLLERELHYKLRFHDVWPLLMKEEYPTTWLDWDVTDYGGMAKYFGELYKFKELYLDGNGWMLQDPTTHRENAERILKVWRPLIQSGFQVTKPSEELGEDESQAGNEADRESSETASNLQNLHLHNL